MLNETVKAFPRVYEHAALIQNEATLGTAWAALPGPRDKMQGRPGADTMKVPRTAPHARCLRICRCRASVAGKVCQVR